MASYDEMISIGHDHFHKQEFEQALVIFRQLMDDQSCEYTSEQRAALLYKCGICHHMLHQYDPALDYLHQSAETARKFNLSDRYLDSWKYIGLTHLRLGEFRTALEYFNDVLEMLDIEGKPDQYLNLLNMTGVAKSEMGDFEGALTDHLESLRIAEKIAPPKSLANTCVGVGTTCLAINDYKSAKKYFQRAYDLFVQVSDKIGQSSSLCNLAMVHNHGQEYDKALECYQAAYRNAEEVGNKLNMSTILHNISRIYYQKNDFTIALVSDQNALKILRELQSKREMILSLINIGDCYLRLRFYPEAMRHAEEALKLALQTENKRSLQACYFLVANIFEARGDFRKAVENLKELIDVKDEFYEEETRRRLTEMQTKYETQKREEEAKILRQQNIELEQRNKLIEEQKVELGLTLEKLQKSEIKYEIIKKDFLKNISRDFIGESQPIRNIRKLISMVSGAANTNVLIIGESGTGKEIVARHIHTNSVRNKYNFYAVNSSAIPESLFESEFFGYDKNAFTGATRDHVGWFEIADRGTLFFDEISAMQLDRQVKLLRALEERKITRLGSHVERPFDVRIISASNTNLYQNVKDGEFREDLYHRLSTFTIIIPPLRERKDDIPLLLEHFVIMFSELLNKRIRRIADSVGKALMRYDFPGNVRELRNLVERAMIVSDSSTLKLENFVIPNHTGPEPDDTILKLDELERHHILKVLRMTGFHQMKAAELLGVDRKVIARRIKKYGIEIP